MVEEDAFGRELLLGTDVFGVLDVLLGVEELLATLAWLLRRSA